MTAAASGPTPAEAPSPYLHHPWIDALVGYGGLYLLTAPLVIALASSTGLLEWPIWFATIAALLISVPHYGATYLRVYEKRSERRRYAVFAIYLTGALFAAFVASLYSARLGSIFLTIYIYWSPWHFAGQNFGVTMTSLRRRRVHIDSLACSMRPSLSVSGSRPSRSAGSARASRATSLARETARSTSSIDSASPLTCPRS